MVIQMKKFIHQSMSIKFYFNKSFDEYNIKFSISLQVPTTIDLAHPKV